MNNPFESILGVPFPKTKPTAEEIQPRITMTFSKFLEGKYQEGKRNLYIIWRGKQALYVGIARDHIWGRWFNRGAQGHMYFIQKYSGTLEGGKWVGSSPIGSVIARNFPKSLKWKVELQHYTTLPWTQNETLEHAEQRLIGELRPLFNVTYRGELTTKEQKLAQQLIERQS